MADHFWRVPICLLSVLSEKQVIPYHYSDRMESTDILTFILKIIYIILEFKPQRLGNVLDTL